MNCFISAGDPKGAETYEYYLNDCPNGRQYIPAIPTENPAAASSTVFYSEAAPTDTSVYSTAVTTSITSSVSSAVKATSTVAASEAGKENVAGWFIGVGLGVVGVIMVSL